jgi:hypothetical protein
LWDWQRPLHDTTECLGTVGTGTARQLVRGGLATPARPDSVADHTCDDVWVILSSNGSTAAPVQYRKQNYAIWPRRSVAGPTR